MIPATVLTILQQQGKIPLWRPRPQRKPIETGYALIPVILVGLLLVFLTFLMLSTAAR